MQPAILGIIVTYNSAAVLPACLASLWMQVGVTLRVVVVDNGSADGSARLAQAEAAKLSVQAVRPAQAGGVETHVAMTVRVVDSGENIGFARGCNHGLTEGLQDGFQPQYILYINPDVRFETPGVLAALAAKMAAEPAVAIATPRLVRENGSLDWACRRSFPGLWNGFCRATGLTHWPLPKRWVGGYNLLYLDPAGEYDVPCVTGAFMLCDAAFVRAQGGFDERYFMYIEDVDLCWQAQTQGRKVRYVGSLTAQHSKGHASAAISDDMLAAMFHSTRLWYAKCRYAQMNLFSRGMTRLGLWGWERMARLRNRLRTRKSAQP